MASTDEQSKTLFDTSKPPPEDRRPVILLDQTFSSANIAAHLRVFPEWRVELHGEHFTANMPDDEWIPECGRRGWLVLSCDKEIRRSPEVVAAVQKSKAKVFFMGKGGRRGEDYMSIIGTARHRILRTAKQNAGPFFARVTRNAEVEVVGDTGSFTSKERTDRKYVSGSTFKQFDSGKQKNRRRRKGRETKHK